MSRWLEFKELKPKPKTKVFVVVSKRSDDKLGMIEWYNYWRHYCFFPNPDLETVHSDRCLMEISQFITKLNVEHGKKHRTVRKMQPKI